MPPQNSRISEHVDYDLFKRLFEEGCITAEGELIPGVPLPIIIEDVDYEDITPKRLR